MPRFCCVTALVLALFALAHSAQAAPTSLEDDTEKAVGRVVARALVDASGDDVDPLLVNWVNSINAKIAPLSPRKTVPISLTILGSDIANAFSMPGGHIFVTRGLLDSVETDDELASVLAHETGHVARRHAAQQIEGNLLVAAFGLGLRQNGQPGAATALAVANIFRTLHKSREMENQADELGVQFAFDAGYDPNGLVRFFQGFNSGKRSPLENYLATHPDPNARIAHARESPLVTRNAEADRTLAQAFAARDLPGLAEAARRGDDPLAAPPRRAFLPNDAPVPAFASERSYLVERAASGRRALEGAYQARRVGVSLQQLLLVNSSLGDVRWAYLSGRAYSVQARVDDVYARTLRVLRDAPGAFDGQPPGPRDPNGVRGRDESARAVERALGAPVPLQRASRAVALALVDLNNRYFRIKGNSEPWIRLLVIEGLLRYAESELARADKASGQAWRLLSLAQTRRWEARLTELVPADDAAKRALWYRLAERRFGTAFAPARGETTGAASVRAALATEKRASGSEIAQNRGDALWADWVLAQKGTPENIATCLRLLSLELGRELAAEERYAVGN